MNQLKYKILPETAFTSLKVYFKYTALFMIFSFQTTYAQRCGSEDNLTISSPLSSSPALCANPQVGVVGNNSLFIPYQGDNRDLKEVAVVFHVIQKSSSDPQNFTTADIPYLRSLLDVINNNIVKPINCPIWNSNGGCVCDESHCENTGTDDCCISDAKLKFVLDEDDILFHVDEYAYYC